MNDFEKIMGGLGNALAELGITTVDPFAMVTARRVETGGVLVQIREHRFLVSEATAKSLREQLDVALASAEPA